MHLTPKLPPGRANRKALAFACEIQRLRSAGYSFEAIRLALRDVGIQVSRSTVKREAARRCVAGPTAPQRAAARAAPPVAAVTAVLPATASFAGDPRSGKEIAEAFVRGRISNPLMQAKTGEPR
jgi:hypothetical protein